MSYDLSETLLQPKLPESDSDQIVAESFNKFFIDTILKSETLSIILPCKLMLKSRSSLMQIQTIL